jgi:hypothetical protein
MPLYTYKAIDAQGKSVVGRTEAVNPFDLEQRLVRMGFGHRGTAYIEYAVMAACAGLALLVLRAPAAVQSTALALAAAALAGVALWVDRRWRGSR